MMVTTHSKNRFSSSPLSTPAPQHLLGHGLLPPRRGQHFLCLGRRAFLACGKGVSVSVISHG